MGKVKVTREHRVAAALFRWPEYEAAVAPKWLGQWLDGGEAIFAPRSMVDEWTRELDRIARFRAETEHRVRTAVIEQLKALVDRAKSCDHSLYHVDGQSLECLIDELEDANNG